MVWETPPPMALRPVTRLPPVVAGDEGDDASAVESRAPALRSAIGQRRVTR